MKTRRTAVTRLLATVALSGILLQSACTNNPAESTEPEETPEEPPEVTMGYPETGGIVLAWQDGAAPICYDANSADADGVSLIADAVAGDFELVTGSRPELHAITKTDELPDDSVVIIAGTLDDALIGALGLSWEIAPSHGDSLSDEWERYEIQVTESGGQTQVVVAGSDKRGTIYGLFHLSQELGGVSPWVYWADVKPAHRDMLAFSKEELTFVSKTPSVKFRGIFLNDEAPSLSGFVSNRFGNYNYLFYANVFELILRLRGNYLWPAMWGNSFSDDGIAGFGTASDISNLNKLAAEERTSLANAYLADDYGIVMGLSHHEPMMRAGVEWQRLQNNNNPVYQKPTKDGAPLNAWNYFLNRDNIHDFWVDGFARNQAFEKLIPIGMRGENDSELRNPDGTPFTLAQNIELLKSVITDQKGILKEAGHEDDTQVLVLYKEVEKYWYGSADTAGLNQMEELKDDIIVLCEDNNNFLRTLPTEEERDRRWGLYYHFDYVGGPRSYMWLNVTPLERVWDNLTMAYDYKVDDLWVVNVGDLKPMELPISYFLDLAYDFETYGTENPNSAMDYTRNWVNRQFAGMELTAEQAEGVAQLISDYVDMNGRKRPETIFASTFSTVFFNEAQTELAKANRLRSDAETYLRLFEGTDYADAFYQLVYYPAAAVATVNEMWLYQGLNELYEKRGSALANVYAALVEEALQTDKALMDYYNYTMSGGYWRGMMGQVNHTGYTQWNHESATYPTPRSVTLQDSPKLIVDVQGSADAYTSGDAALPDFESTERQHYALTLSNGGKGSLAYTVETSADWILVETGEGSLEIARTLEVSVDWAKLSGDSAGTITVEAASGTVTVHVNAKLIDTSSCEPMTFFASNGFISIPANRYAVKQPAADGTDWLELENYGRFGTTMKMAPTTASFPDADGPYLEYRFFAPEDGDYSVMVYVGAANNRYYTEIRQRYGLQFDGEGEIFTYNSLGSGYVSGDSNLWSQSILNAGRMSLSIHALTAGVHTLRIYGVDAGLLLEKITLTPDSQKPSFFGPPATYYVGSEAAERPLVWHRPTAE